MNNPQNALTNQTHLSPKGWVSLNVQNFENIEQGSKQRLNEEDRLLLEKGYEPRNKKEKNELDMFMGEWQKAESAYIEAKISFLSGEILYEKLNSLAMFFNCHGWRHDFIESMLKKHFPNYFEGDLSPILVKNSWVDFDHLVYLFTFELMDADLRDDLLVVDNYALFDWTFLQDQKIFGEIMQGNKELTYEIRYYITHVIMNKIYCGADTISFLNNFASIPIIEIAKRWAQYKDISIEPNEQDIEKFKEIDNIGQRMKEDIILGRLMIEFCKRNETDLQRQIQTTIFKWLDEGMLENFQFLYGNNNKIKGRQGKYTSRNGQELYDQWQKFEQIARKRLQQLIDSGELEIGSFMGMHWGKEMNIKVVSAKSLYNLKHDLQIVKDFREQIESAKTLGALIKIWNDIGYRNNYLELSKYLKVISESSKKLGIDLSYMTKMIEDYINNLDCNIKDLDSFFIGNLISTYTRKDCDPESKTKFLFNIKLSSLKNLKV